MEIENKETYTTREGKTATIKATSLNMEGFSVIGCASCCEDGEFEVFNYTDEGMYYLPNSNGTCAKSKNDLMCHIDDTKILTLRNGTLYKNKRGNTVAILDTVKSKGGVMLAVGYEIMPNGTHIASTFGIFGDYFMDRYDDRDIDIESCL